MAKRLWFIPTQFLLFCIEWSPRNSVDMLLKRKCPREQPRILSLLPPFASDPARYEAWYPAGSSLPTFLETSFSVFLDFFVLVLVLRPKGSTRTRSSSSIEYEYEYHFIEYEYEVRLEMWVKMSSAGATSYSSHAACSTYRRSLMPRVTMLVPVVS